MRRNNKATAIAILLTLAIATSFAFIPNVRAHTPPYQIPTHAYIWVVPDPVGVGQTVTIFMWLDQVFGVGYDQTSYAQLTNNYRFHNYQLTITKPDGTTETKVFERIVDTTSNQYTKYIPNQAGAYKFTFNFPGQTYNQYPGEYNPNSILVNDTYLPSSASVTINVLAEPVASPIGSLPLPTKYWTRPIYGEATDWWKISSNWLGNGSPVIPALGAGEITTFSWGPPLYSFGSVMQRYPGDAIGPETAHVMWTKPLQSGGVVGGNMFEIQGETLFEGSAYVQRYANPIIVNGKLYYTEPLSLPSASSLGGGTYGPTKCVDLHTGQLIWSRTDVPALAFAYIYDIQDPQQHGAYPAILFTSNFARAFDADTGTPLFNVTGVPAGPSTKGPQGEHLRYVFMNAGTTTSPNWVLGQWNSSKLWTGLGYAEGTSGWVPTISGTVNASISTGTNNRYDWNVSIPWRNTMTTPPTVLAPMYGNMLLCMNGTFPSAPSSFTGPGSSAPYTYFAVNLNASRGAIGSILWWNTLPAPAGNLTVFYAGAEPTVNVFLETYKETMNFAGFSLATGQKLWGPTESQESLDYYGQPGPAEPYAQAAYGRLYSSGYGGTVYCYDLTNGNKLWTYGNGGEGNNTRGGLTAPMGVYPTFINAVGNGKIYLVTTEHTVTTPIYKGALARCIDAFTGEEVWTLSDYTGEFVTMSYAIADGYATFFNGYDNQIYVVGRGPSDTTVTAPDIAVPYRTPVVFKGSVMDISAGAQQYDQAARFPKGVPVMADESMKDWMGYVYQDMPLPIDAKGVEVVLSVLDSNNNFREIGKTTTDHAGFFKLTWTPDIEGDFIVYASFAGTKAYWPSEAQNAFTVTPAAPVPPEPEPAAPGVADTYFWYAVAGIIATIAIVGIVLIVLMLRKRP